MDYEELSVHFLNKSVVALLHNQVCHDVSNTFRGAELFVRTC
jgi:hypothetical protein